MEIKAKDMCPRCKHCEGLDIFNMYNCKHYNRYPDAAIGMDCEIECANFEEVNMNKVEGKVKDWCKNCKYCDTIKMVGMDTEYICSDPYDGMEKTLNGDSNVTCSMYEARPNPTHVCYEQEVKVVKPGEKVDIPDHGRYPWGKDKSNLYFTSTQLYTMMETMSRQKDMENKTLRSQITKLEKEKVAHMKGIERLKKSNNNLKGAYNHLLETLKRENEAGSNIVEENVKLEKEKTELIKASKRKDELIQDYREKLKKADELADSWKRDYERIREQFLCPIYDILYPDNPNLDINVTALLDDVKNLKIQSDENGAMYKNLDYWRDYWKDRCHKAETDVTTLNSKVEVLDKRNTNQFVMIGEKDKEINKLNQTIEDQDITIKALLITIKEMCKDE